MNITPTEAQEFLELLAEAPHRIDIASKGLEDAQLNFKPDENTWTANEIFAHLRSAADVWGKSIQEMLTKENPTIRYISPRTWIKKTNYLKLEFRPSFQAYRQQRQETVFSYARRITQHEQAHCDQIEALLKLMQP